MGKTLYLIDTNSLLSLVKYYLAFDNQNKLYSFVEEQFKSGTFILLKAVFNECKTLRQGLILDNLQFLKENIVKKHSDKTATQKIHN